MILLFFHDTSHHTPIKTHSLKYMQRKRGNLFLFVYFTLVVIRFLYIDYCNSSSIHKKFCVSHSSSHLIFL